MFRGTMSMDIRAPNLNDLFQPTGISSTGFPDLLTGASPGTQLVSRGNPALMPEQAHTYTLGFVLTPEFIPGFTFSADWYTTHMSAAIQAISYQSTQVQTLCIQSAPLYNSPYCSLAIRPFAPGSPQFTTPANYPSQLLNQPFNTAKVAMEGFDFEIDYN